MSRRFKILKSIMFSASPTAADMYPRPSRPRTKGHSFHQTTSLRIQIGFPKSVDSKQQPQDQRLQSLVTQVSKDDAPRSVPRFAVPMIPRSNQAVLGPQS